MNRVQQINALGQSIWYDNISRRMITQGELQQRVDEGLTGVTSNPTIFDKAISAGTDYDEQLHQVLQNNPGIEVGELIKELMVRDIQMACDVLMPVFLRTKGEDGFVSVEVSPGKAHDAAATIEEVRDLWKRINRRNLMVKIPATREGLAAIEQATAEGININITLIFAVERYREVADAYLAGLERRVAKQEPLDHIASVASVFVSRIDTLVDDLLQRKIAAAGDRGESDRLRALLGQAAIANAKMIYQVFREVFGGQRFTELKRHGAHLQRPLWGSTGTKNPDYSDVKYVDSLLGPHTVNTVPPATYQAILDHATVELTIERDLDAARRVLDELKHAGIDMRWVTDKLEKDGVAAFEKSFDGLTAHLTQVKEQV